MIDRLPLPKRQKDALRQAKITQSLLADAIVKRDKFSLQPIVHYEPVHWCVRLGCLTTYS
jgi:hypothetical protein